MNSKCKRVKREAVPVAGGFLWCDAEVQRQLDWAGPAQLSGESWALHHSACFRPRLGFLGKCIFAISVSRFKNSFEVPASCN